MTSRVASGGTPQPRPQVFEVEGRIRDYPWGSTTAIQRMLGLPVDGRPAAELWFGDHPGAPSAALGSTLDAVLAADPERLLGRRVAAQFGNRLPFLLKVLAADKPLSIQVHPDRQQAEAGYAAEDARGVPLDAPERNYRDRNHKPELLCALTEFEALCGFRPVADTLRLLDALDVPDLAPVRAHLERDGVRAAFTYLVTLDEPTELVAAVAEGAEALPSVWSGVAGAVRHAAEHFPGDVGVALALLLNHVRLRPGEAVYLGAGNVHAYLHGVGVEIMANSDNVLRCGLTVKHVDVDELLKITDFSELAEPRWSGGEQGFAVPVPDFALRPVRPGAVGVPDRPGILLCTGGELAVADLVLAPGHAAYLPPGASAQVDGVGEGFLATVGRI